MSPVGVTVNTSENPPATNNEFDTASAYMVGQATWGPVGRAVKVRSLSDLTSAFAAPGQAAAVRSGSLIPLYDAVDAFLREGGSTVYVSRAVGATPVNATLTLNDAASHPTLVITARYPGSGGNGIFVVVTTSGSNFTITLQDSLGNVIATSGLLADQAAAIAWGATLQHVTIVASTAGGATTADPAALTATALVGGTSDSGTIALTQYQTALAAFTPGLGPGQVSVPGVTNATINGIWSALGVHAQANNRIALCDMTDTATASTLVANFGQFGLSDVASYCGFWAGQVIVPGVTPDTTRTVPASAVVSALCARGDANGNPNLAPAGVNYALQYAIGLTEAYSSTDINTLNAAGINSFNTIFSALVNYGFVSAVPESVDPIFFELSAGRLRMAIKELEFTVGQEFLFDQIDGAGIAIAGWGSALAGALSPLVTAGALYVTAPDGSTDQGFSVDVGSTVNTPTTIAAGQLNGDVSFRPSPFAQMVTISLNAVPVTQAL